MTDKHHLHTLILPETRSRLIKQSEISGLSIGQVIDGQIQEIKRLKAENARLQAEIVNYKELLKER